MRTDQEPAPNIHLELALKGVETQITDLYKYRAMAEDQIKKSKESIEQYERQLEEAETAKKHLQRAILNASEEARYLKGEAT